MGVAGSEQHEGGEDAGEAAIAVLEGMNREEDNDEAPDEQERVKRIWRRPSRSSTYRSVSFESSIRVEDPTLSIVATLRREVSFSGERLRIMRHYPLNSSSSAINRSISGVMVKTGGSMAAWLISWLIIADYSRFRKERNFGRFRTPRK